MDNLFVKTCHEEHKEDNMCDYAQGQLVKHKKLLSIYLTWAKLKDRDYYV
jgi:hypothetical protein